MAEEFLNDSEIGSTGQKVGCEAVSERVRAHGNGQASLHGAVFHEFPDQVSANRPTTICEKNEVFGFSRFSRQLRSPECEIFGESLPALTTERHHSLFIAFAHASNPAVLEVDIVDPQASHF